LKYSDCGGASVDPAQIKDNLYADYNVATLVLPAKSFTLPAKQVQSFLMYLPLTRTNCPNLSAHARTAITKRLPT
jgi:hypothetical protein